ncbi:RNA polymerase 2 ctd phosphatase [Grosmannia clavigera kw1407]|uniref:RNA polymerase II subunit A C-terminal domain phosphatase n=1 Tax=Grosmannia clavigera (strain kw1407 / UAMH 11150) TaxID=655863 RepID=F0XF58_GROCL|nr:RNA polymerase 2 ctd phosphatase [Grosmannia clavigera kw1407]EFX03725.1 RNA polymerase 2 ctd phosphatase [Grosmannia clavigera kw1407]
MSGGKKGEKVLGLGARLKYPITITRLYKNPGDSIRRQEPILQYSFEYTMELPNDRETLQLQTKTLKNITDWNAPEDGKLLSWQVRVGDVVSRDRPCATVEEACTHEIQFQGLCALCGKDMNEVNWASEQRDTDRAPINMTHDQTSLTVSRVAATRAENELQQRLLSQRKLSLVVDLDQTIIHACIDPTIGEWQQDPSNPNYEALKDVRRFQLEEGFQGLARGCWYYIKMRPHLTEFLEKISTMYELHVYTMGTRTYATNIAQIVDPNQKLFGNRVISRDENGNIIAKSLQRLFPVSTNMAVIIDDRADVWPYNRHNLIKVNPYDFFKGTGDINSSFLPQRSDISDSAADGVDGTAVIASTAVAAIDDATVPSGSAAPSDPASDTVISDANQAIASSAPSAAAAAVSASGVADGADGIRKAPEINGVGKMLLVDGDDATSAIFQKQAEQQERTIEQQIKDRPLLHMQEQLDKEDEAAAAAAAAAVTASQVAEEKDKASKSRPRHCVLYDDDNELLHLEKHLERLHHSFYEAYDSKRSLSTQNSSRSALHNGNEDSSIAAVPDVGKVLDGLKDRVLHGATIVLSGLVPLGLEVERSELGLQSMSFGARLQKQISRKVTHLVISSDRPRTQKVRQAARIPSIKIVNQHWLADSFSQWAWVDETPYLVNVHPADRDRAGAAGPLSEATDSETLSDQESERGNGNRKPRIVIAKLGGDGSAGDGGGREDDGPDDEDDEDDNSPIAELGQFDWGSADDELEMFLAEADDDDGEGENRNDYGEYDSNNDSEDGDENGDEGRGYDSVPSLSKRKMSEEPDGEIERSVSRGRTLAAKRQRLGGVRSRSTSKLRAVATPASEASNGHPLRQLETQTSGENNSHESMAKTATALVVGKPGATPARMDVDEDDLEAMLMAELDEEEAAAAAEANG